MLTWAVASTYSDPVKTSMVYLHRSAPTLKPLTDEVDGTDRGLSTVFSWKDPGSWYTCRCSLTHKTLPNIISGKVNPPNASSFTDMSHVTPWDLDVVHSEAKGATLALRHVPCAAPELFSWSVSTWCPAGGPVSSGYVFDLQGCLGRCVIWLPHENQDLWCPCRILCCSEMVRGIYLNCQWL